MARTHAQQFAISTLPGRVFADPVGVTRGLATDPVATLMPLWDEAGGELPPIARYAGTGLDAKIEPVGRYAIAIVTLPAPRESGDPVAVAIIGRGDVTSKLSTIAYNTLELSWNPSSGPPTFGIFSLTGPDARARVADGPLPDLRWFAAHALDLYHGRQPAPSTGVAELPFWYWWYAFDGPTAFRMFNSARDDAERFEAVRKAPILLLPEITTAVETFSGTAYADKLREIRPYLRRDKTMAETWKTAITQIVNAKHAPLPTNIFLALPLVAEAGEHGALTKVAAYELESSMRGTLAGLGIDPHMNSTRAHELYALAVEAATPRSKRGSAAPGPPEDPMAKPLFLDQTDLPDHQAIEHNETFASVDPTFLAHGGLRAGYITWAAGEWSAMSRLIDARWVFRTPAAAAYFMHAISAALGEGLPAVAAPKIGDQCLAFGDDSGLVRRTQVLAVRVGRVVIRIKAVEGADAAASRQMLHAQMLYPIAGRAANRAHTAQLRYWLAVEYPTNAIAALVHTPGHDVARLLPKHPLLALGELPEAIRLRADDRRAELDEELKEQLEGEEDPKKRDAARAAAAKEVDKFKSAADTLANFQAQLRAHRWSAYRDAMLALTRALLESDLGNTRVNAAYAMEIVAEIRHIDNDPVWAQLEAVCRSRS